MRAGRSVRVGRELQAHELPETSGGVHARYVGTRGTGLGTQVTYKGHPLYLFANEGLNPTTLTAAGNGNGVGGFSLVSP